MSERSLGAGDLLDPYRSAASYWECVVPALGVLLLVAAVARSIVTFSGSGALLEAVLDLLLVGSLGLVLLYIGVWLPETTIPPGYYRRIVGWVAGGIALMAVVLGLRVVHPGVTVEFTFGTQAVLLATGSIAGLGTGVLEAQTRIHAETIEERNADLERTERRLEDAVTELEASNERLEQFAYAASHDLQEPLRMVTSYLQLIEERHADELDEETEEFLAYAVDGADRMGEMIDGLLEYSRVEAQGDPFEAVDLDAVLDDVRADLQFRIDETDSEVTSDPLPTVEGDRSQLRQVFQNLLSNAIDYSGDDPPRVHVSAARSGAEWTVSVSDDGPGIDPADADRVFEVFERLHSADEQAGSGIGLALCERIVERHGVQPDGERPGATAERSEPVGGEIWVDSEPGEGATFSFTLPAA